MATLKDDQFSIVEGRVLDERTDSHTHVYSYGPDQKFIGSNVIKTQSFWLKLNNGEERHIELRGSTAPLRPGHDIAIIYVEHNKSWWPSALYIKNTKQLCLLYDKFNQVGCLLLMLDVIIPIVVGIYLIRFFSGNDDAQRIIVFVIPILIIAKLIIRYRKVSRKNKEIISQAKSVLMKHI